MMSNTHALRFLGLEMASIALVFAAVAVPGAAADTGGEPEREEGVVLAGGELEPQPPQEPTTPRTSFDPSQPPILGAVSQGAEALDLIGDRLAEVAARNGMAPDELERLLLADPAAHLDGHGLLFYVDPAPDPTALSEPDDVATAAGPFPYGDTFLLNSKPGSNRTIYLDFDGHTITDTAWVPGNTYTTLAFDTDGAPTTFIDAELDAIQSVWQRVAEDYAPFDVNVTTQDPGYPSINRSSSSDQVYGTRVVITSSPRPAFCGNCGGVAFVGVFNFIGAMHDYYQPAWCFNSVLPGAKSVAECVSHELGHNVGLNHDGQVPGSGPYYTGHDPWAPVMGVGYYQPVTQFSKGEYANATNTEDDLVVMATYGLMQRADDHTNVTTTATVLVATQAGVITSEADYDTFRFDVPSTGSVTFVASPTPVSPNLDIELRLFSSSFSLLTTSAPAVTRLSADLASGMDASITHSVVAGETYFVQVSGGGHLTASTGYTRYGSIGAYGLRAENVTGTSMCNGMSATIVGSGDIQGTPGDDVIVGSVGDDTVRGHGGDDSICTRGGDDRVRGGSGDDSIEGGSGNDILRGNAGDDYVDGGERGCCVVDANTGDDLLFGGKGDDILWAADFGAAEITGGGGDDEIHGLQGSDLLIGGSGRDVVTGGASDDFINIVDGVRGNDTADGETGTDTCRADRRDVVTNCE